MRRSSYVVLWALILLAAPFIRAQSVTISASNLSDGGAPANGRICWAPTLSNGAPTSYHLPGGGQSGISANCATVTSGAFTLPSVDTALTAPQNICFKVTFISSRSQAVLAACVQPTANNYWCSSGACNFDAYIPSTAVLPTVGYVQSINGLTGPISITGCNVTGSNALACNGGTGGGSIGDSDVVGQTAPQGTVNVVGTVPASGKYRISYYADQNALCTTGSMTVLFTFSWTDATLARSVQSIPLTLGSAALASQTIQGVIPIFAVASSSITYTSTIAGACATGGPASYDAHVTVEAVQ